MVGFDMNFRQLTPGPQDVSYRILAGENAAILKMGFNRGYHQRAYHPPGRINLGIPDNGAEYWFGSRCQEQSIFPFNQASGIDVVSQPGFCAHSISLDEGFLQNVSETFHLPVAEHLYAPSPGEFIPNSLATQQLRQLINTLTRQGQARRN